MAQLITVRLNKSDQQPLGFRLQGGKDFGTPLVVQKVNGGSAAERAGLQAGDALIRVNNTDVYTLRHQEAQDTIRAAGTALELTVQRGGGTWRPAVTPTGSLPRPGSRPLGSTPTPVTTTSLKANPQPSRAFGSGHNNVAKPFGYMNGSDSVKSIVNKQYNTPVNIYSDKTIAETLSAQTEVLAGGVLGVNFKKNEKTYDAEKSAVFKVLQEEENDPEPVEEKGTTTPVTGLRHVSAPVTRPDAPINNTGGLPPGQNICEECERLITGVFVRIKDKNLHVECFKCSTCGSSLKNQGYYNLNGKLYCDIHAKLVARQNPPAPNLEPVTVPPGARVPTNAYSTPLPPLATNNYTNGSSSMFSPSSNLSGPKPFGSSIGSAYSPASLSPRSAPLSPARPGMAPPAPAPAPAPVTAPFAPTKNVKTIVWPPQNPPEDEPLQETVPTQSQNPPSTESALMSAGTLSMNKESTTQITNDREKSGGQIVSTSRQTAAMSSNVSYSSTMTTETATVAETGSILQSNESEFKQKSSCTVQSTSEKSTSESKTFAVSQSQSNHPDEPIMDTKMKMENMLLMEKSSTQKVEESASVVSHKTIKASQEVKNTSEAIEATKSEVTSSQEKKVASTSDNISQDLKVKDTKESYSNVDTESSRSIESSTNANKLTTEQNTMSHETSKSNTPMHNPKSSTTTESLVDALTVAPDRPYSPLPQPAPGIMLSSPNEVDKKSVAPVPVQSTNTQNIDTPAKPSPIFGQQPKRAISPIPPIKTYNPSEKKADPIPMPPETTPYIPPDFKITIEPKVPRDSNSPFIEALTTAPQRPFTPVKMPTIERGSLREALTIAPDRPYSPLNPFNIPTPQTHYTSTSTKQVQPTSMQMQPTTSDLIRPVATQTSNNKTLNQYEKDYSELSMQNTCKIQSSSETSAFKPVAKQVFPPPLPEEFCMLGNFPPISNDLKSNFQQFSREKSEMMVAESKAASSSVHTARGYSSVKTAQSYFEQLDKKETLSSTAVRSKSGLHKPDSIPTYQQNFEQLPSQRGISPELYRNSPAIPQRPVTPTSNPPSKSKDRSQEPKPTTFAPISTSKIPQLKTPTPQVPVQFKHNDTPISMTFQPVPSEHNLRVSPVRSRPSTPSLINKPAPIIPHYQLNLVNVEHLAPEAQIYDPSSREASRSPTPRRRSRSPAPGPPGNPLKAQAPRIKESTYHPVAAQTSVALQSPSTLRREHELAQTTTEATNIGLPQSQNQAFVMKQEGYSNVGYKTDSYQKGDVRFKEDSMINQNYGQRQMQSQNVSEFGNTTVQTTKKTFEEFERTQSAKVIEIRKGGSMSGSSQQQIESNIQIPNINAKQVFPPPVMSLPTSQQKLSANITNENISNASRQTQMYQPHPSISGANQDPVCDPTPSTGSGVGGGARGKTFGVSSAPKRGRGVLNKAVLPGSRVPLCGSCNGNIRGPFITALGRIWCPEHFICVNATCRRQLQDIGFVEENGQLYCEFCFEQYIAPACDKCHAKIKGDCLNAIGKHFHPECFSCVYCGKLFGNNPFFLEDGLPYCEADWNELFTTKCFACGFPVEAGDRWVEALNNNYHSQCFNCTVCKKNLEGQSFFARGGRPFCKIHAR
ncbi:PDZ and LIM domain protein Zasp isoform X1 [Epargyreus clarus]|uniref:PDZ and LIM domain protein Zasp isoform X1 n=1 Tax=Epargyreus clarus TaxID=520877 RepID=UPI003C2E011A